MTPRGDKLLSEFDDALQTCTRYVALTTDERVQILNAAFQRVAGYYNAKRKSAFRWDNLTVATAIVTGPGEIVEYRASVTQATGVQIDFSAAFPTNDCSLGDYAPTAYGRKTDGAFVHVDIEQQPAYAVLWPVVDCDHLFFIAKPLTR